MSVDPQPAPPRISVRERLAAALAWTPASFALLSTISVVILLVMIVWWPLVKDYLASANSQYPIWQQMDWLLVSIFAVMSLLIMAGANLKRDAWMIIVGIGGGLAIESWGTQTHLWNYYTLERPPLWIIPAWPVASLAIDRLTRIISIAADYLEQSLRVVHLPVFWARWVNYRTVYWLIFPAFYLLMLVFVWPFLNRPATLLSLLASALIIIAPNNRRMAVLIFLAGSGLGYFLEVWGTTRACWTYYTFQTPPVFAVFAHGLASVAFWRAGILIKQVALVLYHKRLKPLVIFRKVV
jgi:hypothetical protein